MSQQDSIYSQAASVSVFHEITVNEHWWAIDFFIIIRKIPKENDIYSLSFNFNDVSIDLDLPSHRDQVSSHDYVMLQVLKFGTRDRVKSDS